MHSEPRSAIAGRRRACLQHSVAHVSCRRFSRRNSSSTTTFAESEARLAQQSVRPWSLLEVSRLHFAGHLQVSGLDACKRLQDPRFRQAWLATKEFEIRAVRSGPVGQISCHRGRRTERRFRARSEPEGRPRGASLCVAAGGPGRPGQLILPAEVKPTPLTREVRSGPRRAIRSARLGPLPRCLRPSSALG